MKQRRFGKKIAMWLLAMVMVLGIMNLPGLATTAYAAEYAGSGTQDDPYVVTTYDELRDAMMNHTGTFFVKLGADIESLDKMNEYYVDMRNNKSGSYTRCILDLAGHSINRNATTMDECLISVGHNATLIINDSGDTGTVHFGRLAASDGVLSVTSSGNNTKDRIFLLSEGETTYTDRGSKYGFASNKNFS